VSRPPPDAGPGLWVPVASLLLACAVFVADLRRPLGFAHSLLYVMVVVLALGYPRAGFAAGSAALGTALTVLGFFLSPPGGDPGQGLFNRSLAVLLMWTIAALVARYQRAQKALIDGRREAQAYLDIAAVAIVVLDREARATLINRKGCEILERSPEEVLGRSWFDCFVAERCREDSRAGWSRLIAGEAPAEYDYLENVVLTRSGGQRHMAWYRTIMRDAEGRVNGSLSSGEDITERRRAEDLLRRQEALAQLGQMAAVVAHQVRNPLAGIKGAIQIIGSRLPPGSPDRQVVSSILERIQALNEMTRDLLMFARPRPPRLAPVQLHSLLRDAAALLKANPDYAGASVAISGADHTVSADAELLKDAFLNLLLNSAQAMNGTGTIDVSVEATGDRARIAIRDTGPGVPAEIRERLFEPFFTTRHRGTGLGLPIVKSQVEAHGGEIPLAFPDRGGTVVTVSLPAAD